MSREREVTRTITTVTLNILCVNKEESISEDKIVRLSGITGKTTKESLLRLASKKIPAPWQGVMVKEVTHEEFLYAMSEEKFMALAEQRPAREAANTDHE